MLAILVGMSDDAGMASSFLPVDREQQFLLPPSIDEWVPRDHPARFVVEALEVLDLSAFLARHELGGVGRRAYDPTMMVGLLLWAYSNGVFSSRELERRCVSDVVFRFVAANCQPDHATIARFRVNHADALKALHLQVLVMCSDLGLVQLGLVALDGTKVAANASKDANRSKAWLDEQIAEWFSEADATDARETDRYGEARGDEVPAGLRRREDRRARMVKARERAEQTQQRRDASKKKRPKKPGDERGPQANMTDPESGLMPVRGGGFIQGYNAQAAATTGGIVVATTVADTTGDVTLFVPVLEELRAVLSGAGITTTVGIVVADAGYWSLANVTAEVGAEDVLIATDRKPETTAAKAAEGSQAQSDTTSPPKPEPVPDTEAEAVFQRRLDAVTRWENGEIDYIEAARITQVSPSHVHAYRVAYRAHGPEGLRPKRLPRPHPPSPPPPAPPSEAQQAKHQMRVKLTSTKGRAAYRQRSPIIEGVFGHTKHNSGFRRFSRRGLQAADTEWSFVHTANNLTKAARALTNLNAMLAGTPLKPAT